MEHSKTGTPEVKEREREGAGEGERTHVFHPVSLRSAESPQVTLHMTEGQTSQYNTPFSSYKGGRGGLLLQNI